MKYSVVIPMYNSEKTIIKAINSITSQTRYELIDEIIIVDDGSTDNSVEVVNKMTDNNPKIHLIKKINGGAASARNVGIKSAKNNMIALLDADDEWLPQKTAIQNKVLENNPNIRALGTNRIGERYLIGLNYKKGISKVSPIRYCIKCWPCTPSLVFDRRVFENDWYFSEDMTHAEEGLFFLKLAKCCGLYYCNNALVTCGDGKRAFGVSGLSGNIQKMHQGVIKMILKAEKKKYIPLVSVPFLLLYEEIKYLRRKIMSISGS